MKTTRQKLFLCQQLTHWHRTRHLRPVWSRWVFHLPFPEGCPPPPCVLPHSLPVLGAEPSPSSGTRSLYRAHKHTFTHHIYDFYSFSQAFCVRIITYFCWYSLISLLALLYFLSRVWYWDWVSFRCSSTAWKQHTRAHTQTNTVRKWKQLHLGHYKPISRLRCEMMRELLHPIVTDSCVLAFSVS